MDIVSYSKSTFTVYDFTFGQPIKIFNKNKRLLCYLSFILHVYEFLIAIFHAITNSNLYRLYLVDFQCTMGYHQFLFDLDSAFIHLSMIRVYLYLFYYDYKRKFNKFQWLNFLKIDKEQILVDDHSFLKIEAKRYLHLIGLFMKAMKINIILYLVGCLGIIARVSVMAYFELPLEWFVFCTLPHAIGLSFVTFCGYYLYNYFALIFTANCMFIHKNFESLSTRYTIYKLKKLKKNKLNSFARENLIQFNRLIKMFKDGQMNFNYTFSYSTGVMVICWNFPYILLFTNPDLPSFILTSGLYLQGIFFSVWFFIKMNSYVVKGVDRYSKFLPHLIYSCPSIRLKLKLSNFYGIHQSSNPLSYKYKDTFYLTNRWYLFYILESFSIVILIYNFNYLGNLSN